uniref:RELT like 2 n=1 Tax=Sphenodon punctatus TaxID=8508 RepID=A0A8D0GB73_SPHPU
MDSYGLEKKLKVHMSEQNSTSDGGSDPQHSLYMLFLLILVFFIMGLVGFLICHVLKKKGYRCRTFRDDFDPVNKEALTELQANEEEEEEELNEDTVEKIVRCIIQNEANVEALKEMLGDSDGDVPVPAPVPSLCPHRNSQDGGPPHHHTVHLGSLHAPCIHCSRKKRHQLHRHSRAKEGKGKMHPGETTVFSVGRFHVTHIEKKPVSQESHDEPLPEGKQDSDPAALVRSNEKLHLDSLQNGVVQETGAHSKASPEEGHSDALAQGEELQDAPANWDAPVEEPEGKSPAKASSLQDVTLHDIATGSRCDLRKGEGFLAPGKQCFGDPEETKRLDKEADTPREEAAQKAANEVSENKGGQGLPGGSTADLSGKEDTRGKQPGMEHMGQQEHSSMAQDPGVTV